MKDKRKTARDIVKPSFELLVTMWNVAKWVSKKRRIDYDSFFRTTVNIIYICSYSHLEGIRRTFAAADRPLGICQETSPKLQPLIPTLSTVLCFDPCSLCLTKSSQIPPAVVKWYNYNNIRNVDEFLQLLKATIS